MRSDWKGIEFVGMWLRAMRVYQWPKNLVVFAALVFAQEMDDPEQMLRSVAAFVAFCMASSAMYLSNDIHDLASDRNHPEKRHRPLASGAMRLSTAWMLIALLGAGAGVWAWWLDVDFLLALASYVVLNLAYSVALKHMIILDVLAIALGFVIRAMAGALVIHVAFSNWLVVCTLFLALFLAIGKRRNEIDLMEGDAGNHRAVLSEYSVAYLDSLTVIVAAATLLTYAIYTPEVVDRLGTDKLYLTLPFVVFGLFRYLHLVQHHMGGGDPSRVLLKDWPMALTVLLWGLSCVAILYTDVLFG